MAMWKPIAAAFIFIAVPLLGARGDYRAPFLPNEAAAKQQILVRQFREFEQALLRLAHRLERTSNSADREQAANLKKALVLIDGLDVNMQFDKLINLLNASKTPGLAQIKEAMEQEQMLASDIRAIILLLIDGDRYQELKDQIANLAKILKEINRLVREEKNLRAITEGGRMENEALAKLQGKITDATRGVARSMGGNDAGQSSGPSKPPSGRIPPAAQPLPGKKQVEEAIPLLEKAEKNIREANRGAASNDQDDAIKKLEEVAKKLAEILRQLRQEEIERVLAALQARCERMLQMQTAVYEATRKIDQASNDTPQQQPTRAHEQKALHLADREKEIIQEVNKAIQLLEAEWSAVAFPEVFSQLRDDMNNVARRLGTADTGSVTQLIEQDIIATLKEMIAALKKAQEDIHGDGPGFPPPSPPGRPPDPRLIELVNELKMIRSMQARVNQRTRVYANQYPGEQAGDPEIQKELKSLSHRQQRIVEVTGHIDKGKNK